MGANVSAQAAVFTLLTTDEALYNVYGINANRVWDAQALDTPPRGGGPFLILRWEEETTVFNQFGRSEQLTVWAHQDRETSRDFLVLRKVLERVTELLMAATGVDGADGTLDQVTYQGMSANLNDEGYKTITKNCAYKVVAS